MSSGRLGSARRAPKDPAKRLATSLVVRTLRRSAANALLHGGNGAVGLIVPHVEDLALLKETCVSLLRDRERHHWNHVDLGLDERNGDAVRILAPGDRPGFSNADATTLLAKHRRVLVLATDAADIPPFLRQAAEAVEPLAPCNAHALRGMFQAIFGQAPAANALPDVSALSITALAAALRTRASLSRALANLHRLAGAPTAPASTTPRDRATPTLSDLPGLGEASEWGHSLAADLTSYRAGEIGWPEIDRGAVVCGPSGTGKTIFAMALARTCGVPVFIHSLARWQANGHLGDLLKAMRKAFGEARANVPCILFIDEIDAFGDRAQFSDERHEKYCREVVNGFLECLDGAEGREGVVVVGATNFPNKIDPAILRPGRLERVIAIPLPDARARAGILRYHLGADLPGTDLMPLGNRLEGLSGADIEKVVRDAKRRARRDRRPVSLSDLEATVPPLVRLSADAYRRTCLHEAAHALVGCLVRNETSNPPLRARVFREAPPGRPAGETLFARSRAVPLTRSAHLGDITALLAGLAAEELVLGDHCDGCGGCPGSDLHLATVRALALEVSAGMGPHLAYLKGLSDPDFLSLLQTDASVRARVEATLQACRARARAMLAGNRDALEALTHLLERDGQVGFDEIAAAAHRSGADRGDGSQRVLRNVAKKRRKLRDAQPDESQNALISVTNSFVISGMGEARSMLDAFECALVRPCPRCEDHTMSQPLPHAPHAAAAPVAVGVGCVVGGQAPTSAPVLTLPRIAT